MKQKSDTLHWGSYECGCVSPLVEDERTIPERCPKHEGQCLQRYVSNKTRKSVGQTFDRGVTHQNQIVARYPKPVLP